MMKKQLVISLSAIGLVVPVIQAASLYVAPTGNDAGAGTQQQPFATLQRAQQAARKFAGREAVTVNLADGTFYLSAPLVFTAEDSGNAKAAVVYQALPGTKPVISGGVELKLKWEPYKDGIMQAKVPDDLKTEEIFVNGTRQILARYPNFDARAQYFDGFAADAFSKERAARWADPAGGYCHAMHPALWGGFTWLITGKDANGEITKDGGWQNNRGGGVHKTIRFVENISEELDAPGEWFLNRKTHVLYFYPPAGLDLTKAKVAATRLTNLIELRGDAQQPVRFIALKGLTFRHANRTVMDTREPLLRSDWAIFRGGAILFNGAEDCALEDALIDQVGGNAVFVNNYNRRITIRGCEIAKAGASGVVFLGDYNAARNPLFNYNQTQKLAGIDRTPGPKSYNYPADCLVDDCLIHLTGRIEKQTAGVNIDLAQNITVRHCSIYDMPRAGINIGDGCWGGHLIEFCDVFDTVKETGDHGSFNSWGRDRYWHLGGVNMNTLTSGPDKDLPMLDAAKPTILRNSRWRCDHGWDIDLDDGSSNYHIYNNLCLNGGIKNREGYLRTVENNIMVNNSFHPHVWYPASGDVFRHNIVFADYRPAVMQAPPWGEVLDHNLWHIPGQNATQPAVMLQKQSQRDANSLMADAQFVDPATGNYQVTDGSPALKLGFKNFPMDQFGVQKPALKALARTPLLVAAAKNKGPQRDVREQDWRGTKVRNINGQGEMSAYGTPGETGVLVVAVPAGSPLAAAGLQKDDVILKLDGKPIVQFADLTRLSASLKPGQEIKLGILRSQKEVTISLRITS